MAMNKFNLPQKLSKLLKVWEWNLSLVEVFIHLFSLKIAKFTVGVEMKEDN